MEDPAAASAKRVLECNKISGIPALSLKDIAVAEGIRYKFNDYPDDHWDGALFFKKRRRAILINTRIAAVERHIFTFAHELGYHFLEHKPAVLEGGSFGFRCTLTDIGKGRRSQEAEANYFAAELLMPELRFRLDMAGAPVDFDLIGNLAKHYMVSKYACSIRIAGLTPQPCIILHSEHGHLVSCTVSRSAKGALKKLDVIPEETAAGDAIRKKRGHVGFLDCDARKWLDRDIPGNRLYECTHCHGDSGMAMTILKW